MRQRGKVLDTEGPTPKFLYAMLKQLDLKIIDWNRVAADIGISNGHAARMRFSRFRNQMEGTTGTKRGPKKNTTKGKKGDKCSPEYSTSHLLNMPANPLSAPTSIERALSGVKMEPRDNEQRLDFIKSEATQEESSGIKSLPYFHDLPHWYQPNLTPGTIFNSQMYNPDPFLSAQMYPTLEGIPSAASSMQIMNPHPFYPQFTIPQEFHVPDTRNQHSFFNAPVLRWEPHASPQASPQTRTEPECPNHPMVAWESSMLSQSSPRPQTPKVKTEEDNESAEASCKIEAYQLD